MERKLVFPDGSVVKGRKLTNFLNQRNNLETHQTNTPPSEILKGFDIQRAKIKPIQSDVPLAHLEVTVKKGDVPFSRPLFEIPDISIDLTPESEDLPRSIQKFEFDDGKKNLTIEAFFCDTHPQYWKHYKDKKQLNEMVLKQLLITLKRDGDWVWDWTGYWHKKNSGRN